MEIFGGFMVMFSILGFVLTVIWFILPFVIFGIKGEVERTLRLVESIDQRLAAIEGRFGEESPAAPAGEPSPAEGGEPSFTLIPPAE